MPHLDTTLVNRPVWFDLSTSDLEAAKASYGELFGWSYQSGGEALGHYTMAFRNGLPAAAIAPKMPGQEAFPTTWTVYLGVADIAAATAQVTALGGGIMVPPMHIPGNGHMAIATDPDGAVFGLWQADPFPGARIEGEHGAMCWAEVACPNAERNATFYATLLGLRVEKMEVPGVTYFTLHDGEPAVMGVMQMDEQWAGIPPHWMPYFAVADLDAANATFQRHGGTLMHGPIPSPYGRIMVVKDAQGAVFSYMAA
ncbi:MAG: VOC family protein [Gemmatimonadetes bacterium]|nr:VOC family protein [Gemmatimonadota bacterium]